LPVGEIAIGTDGDEAKGRTDIGSAHHLPLIDQIALCVAGAKKLLRQRRIKAP
jgi:hypothetical protein